MAWKIYNIESGITLRAGFDSEDDAKEWMENRSETYEIEDYEIEEMDDDEEEEMLKADSDEVVSEIVEDPFTEEADDDFDEVVGTVSLEDVNGDIEYEDVEELDYK
jgi:arsenate reductase-like glutaredoxin family protein